MSRSIASTTTNRQKYKIVFLGDQGAGKTSIINRFVEDNFDDNSGPTVGIDFMVKNLTHKGKNYRLQLWDTAGQQRFRSLIPGYLKDALCAIFIIDASKQDATKSIDDWVKLFNQHKMNNAVSIICSNKIDITQNNSQINIAAKYAKQHNFHNFAVSAKTGQNVHQMFMTITDLITKKQSSKPQSQTPIHPPIQSPKFQKKQVLQRQSESIQNKVESSNPISLSNSQVGKTHRQHSKCC